VSETRGKKLRQETQPREGLNPSRALASFVVLSAGHTGGY